MGRLIAASYWLLAADFEWLSLIVLNSNVNLKKSRYLSGKDMPEASCQLQLVS